jgi:hypothetical protein
MPWEVVREGATLHVKISAPIADWGSLAIEIDNHLDPPPTVVTLPASIPGGTALDTRMLRLTWDELMDRGIAISRESDVPSNPATDAGSAR